jgi:hypothetical protein
MRCGVLIEGRSSSIRERRAEGKRSNLDMERCQSAAKDLAGSLLQVGRRVVVALGSHFGFEYLIPRSPCNRSGPGVLCSCDYVPVSPRDIDIPK